MMSLALRIPPVVVMVAVAGIMGLAAMLAPSLSFVVPGAAVGTSLLVATGVMLALAGLIRFRQAATTVDPLHPEGASSLVTTGIYRVSRNPMYLGMLLVLFGWATWLSHPLSFVALPLFVVYMNRFQIRPEERILHKKFGETFVAYSRAVRRWL
jgi:protein-S-isoprenylcysteine O-methyltransferase Ste14